MPAGKRAKEQNVFPAKRRKRFLVEEVTYDPQARQEFLTGFHKRKLQRQKHAQEMAALKEKEERKRQKAEMRAERQVYVDRHLAALGGTVLDEERTAVAGDDAHSEDSTDEGDAPESVPLGGETEYDDEDRTATVTVQAVDVTRDGLQPLENISTEVKSLDDKGQEKTRSTAANQRQRSSEASGKGKRKKKKFRYESKTENKLNRAKERAASKAKWNRK